MDKQGGEKVSCQKTYYRRKTRRQMFREQHPTFGRRTLKAITAAAAIVMVCTCCAEVYTPAKMVLFGLSVAWVVGYLMVKK
mgnify:CR=1 FL=1